MLAPAGLDSSRHSAGKTQVKCFHFKSIIIFLVWFAVAVHCFRSLLNIAFINHHWIQNYFLYIYSALVWATRSSQITRRRVGFACVKNCFVFKKHEVYNHALMLLPKSPHTLVQSEIHTTILEATALILILMIRRKIPLGFSIKKSNEKTELNHS